MEIFQKVVLIGSIILLIVILVFIGFLLRHSANNVEWPPTSASCPDNWQYQGDTGGTGGTGSTGPGNTCIPIPSPFIEATGCTGCNALYGSGCTFGGTGGTGACGVCQTNDCAKAPAAACISLVVPYDATSCQKFTLWDKLSDTCKSQTAWDGVTYGVQDVCPVPAT